MSSQQVAAAAANAVKGGSPPGVGPATGQTTTLVAGKGPGSRPCMALVAGSGLQFEERGEHELKGVLGAWRLFSVRS